MFQEIPSKRDICIDTIRLLLSDTIHAVHGRMFEVEKVSTFPTKTLGEAVEKGAACRVCALGSLLYTRLQKVPFEKMFDDEECPTPDPECRRYTAHDLLPEGARGTLRNLPTTHSLPFSYAEMADIELAYEGGGPTLTSLFDEDARDALLCWRSTVLKELGIVEPQLFSPTAGKPLLLQILANVVRNGRINPEDTRVLSIGELVALARPAETVCLNFDDIPLYPRAHWEVDVSWRDLPAFLEKHLSDPNVPLDLDPDFQRGHVWTAAQQTAYVEYVLQGGEQSKTLVFNCPGWPGSAKGPYQILDGKQRLEAVRGFLRGEVLAFGRVFSEFSGQMRHHVGFKWRILALETRAAILRFYLSMNAGGTPHSPEELQRVRYLLAEEARD